MISFTVPGRAQPGGSKRAFVRGGRPVVVDANPNAGAWKERVALAAPRQEVLFDCALVLEVRFYFQRPASHRGVKGLSKKGRETPYPAVRPDATKLVRALEDALTGTIWTDDARVVHQVIAKRWGDRDEAVVRVYPMPLDNTIP